MTGTYFNNLFYNRIDYSTNPVTFIGQYVNVDKSFAQGAEVEFQGRVLTNLSLNVAYTYTSTEILQAPVCTAANFCDSTVFGVGQPLLRRPKNSATALLTYLGRRWGGSLAGSFVGSRKDSDFLGFGIDHAAGYVRVDLGGCTRLPRELLHTSTSVISSTNNIRKWWGIRLWEPISGQGCGSGSEGSERGSSQLSAVSYQVYALHPEPSRRISRRQWPVGIFRLRTRFASRSSYSAQDDSA